MELSYKGNQSLKNQRAIGLYHHFIFIVKMIYRLLLIVSMTRRLILMHLVDLLNGSARNVKFMRMKCLVRDMI